VKQREECESFGTCVFFAVSQSASLDLCVSRGDRFFSFCEAEEESSLKGLIFFPARGTSLHRGDCFLAVFSCVGTECHLWE
jgi:hypothetical protein